MYLQGRASEISLRCNDTKQVRNVSASQCVVAHLPPAVIPLSVRLLDFLVWPGVVICADAKHECQMVPFCSLTLLFSQLSSYEILSFSVHSGHRKRCVAYCLPGQKAHTHADTALRWRCDPACGLQSRSVWSQSEGVRLDTNWPVRVTALQSPAQAWTGATTREQHSEREVGRDLVQLNKNYNLLYVLGGLKEKSYF